MIRTLIVIFLVIVIILQFFLFKSLKLKYDNCIYNFQNVVEQGNKLRDNNNLLKEIYEKSFYNSGLKFNNINVFDIEDKCISVKTLIDSDIKLIYYFGKYSCHACVNEDLIKIKKLLEIIGSNKGLILTDFSSKSEYFQFIRRDDIICKVYNLKGGDINIDEMYGSYIAVVDKNLNIKKYFTLESKFLEITDLFLNIIQKTYFPIIEHSNLH